MTEVDRVSHSFCGGVLARPDTWEGPPQGTQRNHPYGGDDWPSGTPHQVPGQHLSGQGKHGTPPSLPPSLILCPRAQQRLRDPEVFRVVSCVPNYSSYLQMIRGRHCAEFYVIMDTGT